MKDIILKESETTGRETLDHCLTVIQGVLDMDDYEQAYQYLESFVQGIIDQTREETIREVEEGLPKEMNTDGGEFVNVYNSRVIGHNLLLKEIKQSLINLRK